MSIKIPNNNGYKVTNMEHHNEMPSSRSIGVTTLWELC